MDKRNAISNAAVDFVVGNPVEAFAVAFSAIWYSALGVAPPWDYALALDVDDATGALGEDARRAASLGAATAVEALRAVRAGAAPNYSTARRAALRIVSEWEYCQTEILGEEA